MLQYKSFKFDNKEAFINYIESRMIEYWKAHNDSFSNVCEDVMHTGLELDDREGNASSLFFFFLNYKIEILFCSQQVDVLNKS